MHVDVLSCPLMQLSAADLLSKVGNANGIAGIQLLNQEVTAGFDHTVNLVHDSSIHNMQHALLAHRNGGRVGKLNEALHHFGVDAFDGHNLHALLPEAHGEHCLEDRAGGGQHNLVGLEVSWANVFVLDSQGDVTQLLAQAQLVHDAEGLLRVVLQGVAECAIAIVRGSHLRLALWGVHHRCRLTLIA